MCQVRHYVVINTSRNRITHFLRLYKMRNLKSRFQKAIFSMK